jgi:hypothetical protein
LYPTVRIADAGSRNRCLVGPKAAEIGLNRYPLEGAFSVQGKKGENEYTYFELDLSDVWRAGELKESYW